MLTETPRCRICWVERKKGRTEHEKAVVGHNCKSKLSLAARKRIVFQKDRLMKIANRDLCLPYSSLKKEWHLKIA